MRNIVLKRLGIILLLVSILLAVTGFLIRHDLQQGNDERAENAALAGEGQPMGGRFPTQSELDTIDNKTGIAVAAFTACFMTLSLAIYCFYRYASQRDEDHEPVR